MKLAIQKDNGQWWTGKCWGVEQAREVYSELGTLPLFIHTDDPSERYLALLINDLSPFDVCYFGGGDEPKARVYEVR